MKSSTKIKIFNQIKSFLKFTTSVYVFETTFNNNISKIEQEVDNFIELLYDLSNEDVIPLTSQETYIIRKLYGIYNNGEKQSSQILSKELNIDFLIINKMQIYAEKAIADYICDNIFNPKSSKKITTFKIYPYMESKKKIKTRA